jgi:hypothetical protein
VLTSPLKHDTPVASLPGLRPFRDLHKRLFAFLVFPSMRILVRMFDNGPTWPGACQGACREFRKPSVGGSTPPVAFLNTGENAPLDNWRGFLFRLATDRLTVSPHFNLFQSRCLCRRPEGTPPAIGLPGPATSSCWSSIAMFTK